MTIEINDELSINDQQTNRILLTLQTNLCGVSALITDNNKMKKHTLKMGTILFLLICVVSSSFAVPPAVDNHIKVDQFGYRTTGKKIAVISNPQIGYNLANTFTPGTTYQVKRWSDDAVMFTGTITAWNGGATHMQSGDKIWWFDFSSFTTPGSYYVCDVTNNVRSYQFDINDCVYLSTMKQALRTYYYQRCGTAKASPYAQTGWTDTPCHIGSIQDADCRLYSSPTNTATSKNLSGGWHDAGDYNKYVNYTFSPMIDLMLAYSENKTVWGDDYNIPESGNGIPDILDEVKYELDWLLKMQNSNGSVLSMVGVMSGGGSPPSIDNNQRVYGSASTSAAFTAAALFALGAIQFNSINPTYAGTLQTAAINAWNWAVANPNVTFFNAGLIQSSDQEAFIGTYGRLVRKTAAASFLFARTGNATYRTCFDTTYTKMNLMIFPGAIPIEPETAQQDMMLYYASLALATPSVASAIKNAYSNSLQTDSANVIAYTTQIDAYRAFITSADYNWGSNSIKARQGIMFTNMLTYNLDPPNNTNYNNAAQGFINYLHGINPTAFCYLSNMGSYGGENSINEFYHHWFKDGSLLWDRVGTSTYGPAPGYLVGGPNKFYDVDSCCIGTCNTNTLCNLAFVTPPNNQPVQKSYKDWNASWPQNSWTITENSCVYQASYVRLLSRFLNSSCVTTGIDDNNISVNNFIKVFPNPFTLQTTFLFSSELKNAELKVYDVIGHEIKEVKSIFGKQITVNRNNLADGIYFYKLIQDNKIIATGKLIVE